MEINLNPQATLSLQMDMPRIARKDMTLLTELMSKYRGIKLTLATQGVGPDEPVVQQLDALEQALVAARASALQVMQALSMPGAASGDGAPPALTGHSTSDLESDVAREREEDEAEADAPAPEPWDAEAPPELAPDAKGHVPRPEGTAAAADAARAKYGKRKKRRPRSE